MAIDLKSCCKCGAQPNENIFRVSEDAEAVVYVCICGHEGEQIEDAYVDAGMRLDAARSWNVNN
jgi:lysyl-tRNA synthetase class I